MSDIDQAIVAPIEELLSKIPLMEYPSARAAAAGGLGYLIASTVKPSVSYDKNGNQRPWMLTDPDAADATLFPWWAWIVVPGAIFGIFL